jgi:AcrR family transcriptional regulator
MAAPAANTAPAAKTAPADPLGPAAKTGRPSTRDRLLQAASELFYREGTVAVGVDRICQQAQVSKRSMYQLFATKDELVAAALQVTGEAIAPRYLPAEGDPRSPRDRILSVFEWLDQSSGTPEYGGCPFVNTATELKDADHPATVVAREYKRQLTDVFEREARAAGAADPALLAQQLTIVFDGCGSRVVVTGQALNGLAVATATVLIDSAI